MSNLIKNVRGYRMMRTRHPLRVSSSSNFHTSCASLSAKNEKAEKDDLYRQDRVTSMVAHNFPDFIEKWNRETFRNVGYGLSAATAISTVAPFALGSSPMSFAPAVLLGLLTTGYWHVGLSDINQKSHAVRRNYPVLGNFRYIFETIRPELRQYIVEADTEGRPFDRMHRTQIYQRAKNVDDTMPFGTRRNVYDIHHEWACHSMFPEKIKDDDMKRTQVGNMDYGTTKPYSASIYNVSGMSYGAISDHAIIALNTGAKMGKFYQNTGEGGVSRFHRQGGGDIVWNIGTGYFGCGSGSGEHRVFEPVLFQESIEECNGRIKMIELKLSQGAKPGHGGILPKAKITREIADTRKLTFPATEDCHSPARHSSFSNAHELVEFLVELREYSGGLPVGIKMCAGDPCDIANLCKAMVELGNGPDFITIDGGEGGTGAAPPELSNSVGLPLEEGLVLMRNILVGAGLRDKVKLNASGRITSGFSIVRTVALGADFTSAARGFMMSLGCIQALKCNTNKCPTGVATLDKELMFGLDPEVKSHRVFNFQRKTLNMASDIVGVMGKTSFSQVSPHDIMRRVRSDQVRTLAEIFPSVEPGCLLQRAGPEKLQNIWDGSNIKNHEIGWMY